MNKNITNIEKQNLKLLIKQSTNTLEWVIDTYKNCIFMSTAFGNNGLVLIDLVKDIYPEIPIYFIDTGFHFKETLDLRNKYLKRGLNIKTITPQSDLNAKEKLTLIKNNPEKCCYINKVLPMKNILDKKENQVWLSGLSRSQSESRANTRIIEKLKNDKYKIAPLIAWKQDDIQLYIEKNNLPYNKLFDKGYKSIGCEPCTTPIQEHEDLRAGRWRGKMKTECGLHTEL